MGLQIPCDVRAQATARGAFRASFVVIWEKSSMLWPGRRSARFSKGICCRTYRTSGFPLARMVRTVLSGLDETCGLPSRFGFGLHLILKVRPETNGVSNGPRKPKSPAIPIAARMTSTARARKGPMKGIAKRLGLKLRRSPPRWLLPRYSGRELECRQ